MAENTTAAPGSKLYRTIKANDAGPFATQGDGINGQSYENLHVEVLPSGGDNPVLEVLYWSDTAQLFIGENPAAPIAARGVDAPWTFTIPIRGRIAMIVANSGAGAGETKLATSGYGMDHSQ